MVDDESGQMLRRYLICALLAASAIAGTSGATLDGLKLPVFKRLAHPLPGVRPETSFLRPRYEALIALEPQEPAKTVAFEKNEMTGVATLTKIGSDNGLHLSAGAVRNPSQIEHQIDTAISQLKLDPKANVLGQNRTAFLGVGYGLGRADGAGLRLDIAAGARLQDRSYRGRLNYSGESWRGQITERYEIEPSLNVGLSYRF